MACSSLPNARGALIDTASMRAERARRRELSQLVPYHILSNVDRNELVAIMHSKRVSDKVWRNRRPPRPSAHNLLVTRLIHTLDFDGQMTVNEGTFFNRTRHGSFPSFYLRLRRRIIQALEAFFRLRVR